ncbi:hypothetical protein ACLOJK_005275 [Asimina triloba]
MGGHVAVLSLLPPLPYLNIVKPFIRVTASQTQINGTLSGGRIIPLVSVTSDLYESYHPMVMKSMRFLMFAPTLLPWEVGVTEAQAAAIEREESLPVFKRRLLGGLLDFAARELQVQDGESLNIHFSDSSSKGANLAYGIGNSRLFPCVLGSAVKYGLDNDLRTFDWAAILACGFKVAPGKLHKHPGLIISDDGLLQCFPTGSEKFRSAITDEKSIRMSAPPTQVIAAAAAGVAAEGLSPQDAKAEAESAAQLSVALAENAIVILMLVEDHLRLRSQIPSSRSAEALTSPSSFLSSASRSNSLGKAVGESMDAASRSLSLSIDSGSLSIDVGREGGKEEGDGLDIMKDW